MKEIKLDSKATLEEVATHLWYAKYNNDVPTYCIFNGIKISTEDINEENIFNLLDKLSNSIYGKKYNDYLLEYAKEKESYWIEEGKKYIYPELHDLWETHVKEYVKNFSYYRLGTLDFDDVLTIMQSIAEDPKSFEKITATFWEDYSRSAEMTRRIIFTFCKVGPEFFEVTTQYEITPEIAEQIRTKKEENTVLANNNTPTSIGKK